MNKYAAVGILADAADGKRIIVVERDHRAVHEAVRVFRGFVEENRIPARVRVANGAERIILGAGWVRFTTPRSNGMRGLTADVVFIDNDAHRVLNDGDAYRRFRDDVVGVLAATGGTVVHS